MCRQKVEKNVPFMTPPSPHTHTQLSHHAPLKKKIRSCWTLKDLATTSPIIVGGGWFFWCPPFALAPRFVNVYTHIRWAGPQKTGQSIITWENVCSNKKKKTKEKMARRRRDGILQIIISFYYYSFYISMYNVQEFFFSLVLLLCSLFILSFFLANRLFPSKGKEEKRGIIVQSRFRHRHHKPKSEKRTHRADAAANQQQQLLFSKSSSVSQKEKETVRYEKKKKREQYTQLLGCAGPPRSIPS